MKLKSIIIAGLFGCMIVVIYAAGQVAHSSKRKSTGPRAPSSFTCPDPEAKEACKSYEELSRAKDKGLPDNGYICFRKNIDELFVVYFSLPSFEKHWDARLKQMVPDKDAKDSGFGFASSCKDGVSDPSITPNVNFLGTWHPSFPITTSYFTGEQIGPDMNVEKIDESDIAQGIVINDDQFKLGVKYTNQMNKSIVYMLTIQRSTGRFSEKYKEESNDVAFLEHSGRCVFISEASH